MMRSLIIASFLLRLLLIPLDLYRSTDFEVHRNWLAITHSLPLSRWYFEETSQWTLDYPPVFAYFEWLLSQFAAAVDPAMLRVDNLEYASQATVVFQRLSVILGDLVLVAGAWQLGSLRLAGNDRWLPVAVLLCNSGLLIVDHIHFQYNGMMLGLLLLSVADIERGRTYRGAFLFCVLLSMKQIFLYVAPVYFVFLLRGHCGCSLLPYPKILWNQLFRLGAMVVLSFAAMWGPVLIAGGSAAGFQLLQRLFPFGRGLTHAYWAPNIWALYNTADRVLAKLGFGSQSGQSSTAGMAEVYESSALWTVPPKATFILTLLAYYPLLAAIWRQTKPAGASTLTKISASSSGAFGLYVALGSAIAFGFGWHVHEKAILMVTVPLAVVAAGSNSQALVSATTAVSAVATFSIMPLLPDRPMETAAKWFLFLAGHLIEHFLLQRRFRSRPAATPSGDVAAASGSSLLSSIGLGPLLPGWLVALGYVVLGLYRDFGGHKLLLGGRLEFLPLLLTSDFSALLVLFSFLRVFWLIPQESSAEA
ncbi:unnamed protein product [Polarella glacialis]|uniref:Alpha-1,3-glucosyltransferase n=1 Tax=Polarella glacialis TaxID=89957 RepID=A0A813FQ91_POLGL|nr:unnamed protein product [Polarella glacialis]CAE8696040.1 unnamed protein product [Polarella glacialis]